MDWTQAVDQYCERMGPEFWAEPVNAVTNLAFVLAALVVWPRAVGLGRVLAVILVAIGIGSFLFHTFAQPWAGVADVVPILLFILVMIYAANRDFWGFGVGWSLLGVALFVPWTAVWLPLFQALGMGSTAGYAPVPVLILAYAIALWRRAPDTSRGLAIGAGILVVSLIMRMLDEPVCGALPIGTHFGWHLLNAVMLGWMIRVHGVHVLAGRALGR